MNAIALNSSMFNGARVAGPAIAGALVVLVGEGWCFLLNGLSYLAVIAGFVHDAPAKNRNRCMMVRHAARKNCAKASVSRGIPKTDSRLSWEPTSRS